MSPEVCARLKEIHRHIPNPMKRPEVVAKALATKKRNFDFKGRKEEATKRFKRLTAYRDWRAAVFERDDYRCFDCGERGGRLEAHHIYTFAKFPRLRLAMENGITLCRECHKKTPSYGNNRQLAVMHMVRMGSSPYSY
jgi:5-methylcytosine-specific restriction endonuclease McrA